MRAGSQTPISHSKCKGSSERPNTGPYLGIRRRANVRQLFLEEGVELFDRHIGLCLLTLPLLWKEACSTSFDITRLQIQQRKKKKVWNCFNASICQVQFWSHVCMFTGKWSRDNKRSHWERSKCVNERYTSVLGAGLDRQWLFKKSLCFCVGAGSAHPNSA